MKRDWSRTRIPVGERSILCYKFRIAQRLPNSGLLLCQAHEPCPSRRHTAATQRRTDQDLIAFLWAIRYKHLTQRAPWNRRYVDEYCSDSVRRARTGATPLEECRPLRITDRLALPLC